MSPRLALSAFFVDHLHLQHVSLIFFLLHWLEVVVETFCIIIHAYDTDDDTIECPTDENSTEEEKKTERETKKKKSY